MWLNGLIIAQVHHVLRKSNQFIKVSPPSVSTVRKQAAGIYVFAAGWFAWAFFLYYRGLVFFSLGQVVNIWIVTRVCMVAPPLLYVIYVCVDVWWRKLLPRSGRTRVLSLYFLRVVIVFLVTWVPYFIIYEIAWNVTHSQWMVHVSYFLGSIQGFMSVVVALSKPDIKRAFYQFVSFGQKKGSRSPGEFGTSSANATTTLPPTTTETTLSPIATESTPPPTTTETPPPIATESTLSATATSTELPWHAESGSTRRMPQRNRLRTSTRSSVFYQSRNEWNMEDVWDSTTNDSHDNSETEETPQLENTQVPVGQNEATATRKKIRLLTSGRSSIFHRSRKEWNMEDVWDSSSDSHDHTETEGNQQCKIEANTESA